MNLTAEKFAPQWKVLHKVGPAEIPLIHLDDDPDP